MQAKILLVDDESDLLDILELRLQQYDYEVVKASNYQSALKLYKEQDPDVTLLDVTMPEINGFQLCRQLRDIRGPGPQIIIHTGNVDEVNSRKAREAGANYFTVKTGDFKVLVDLIQNSLKSLTKHEK